MGKYEKILLKILRGRSDQNIDFEDLKRLLIIFGFEERIKGSHHIFSKSQMVEILNIQEKGGKAKPYQVKQVRNLILKYRLKLDKDEN
ncbi:type II toxin-antitoxin system HicA family toxin [Algoriphagus aquimarinus]|uniref:Type II toxin-antitoxin system HicA family toxin n=1 Tax=Algoriphagus aquimarinus TaxID=237018 RepID=A0A5C7AEP5_9BACT|nr:type II toxin-antitoxin system HicA family toxin [Algoriphagus aquimarinus]TXE05913.1 type II toxin-antitoxin system HicA family toxin [Algoriphagus aquimarinus]